MSGGAGVARGARFADDWVERVRAASDIVEVIGQTVPLKRMGRNWTGLCPFHKEKSPSFSVNADRQFYHCFGCKAGGDVFRFVQETEGVGFVEAVELLSRRAGIPVPERRPGERAVRTPLLEALEQAAVAYEQWLADPDRGRAAREALEARGVTRETWKAFRLGLAPEGWDVLSQRLLPKVGEDVLVQAGIAARREGGRGVYDRFRHRLMIPFVAPGGAVIGFTGRALGQDPAKYLNSPETPVYHKGSFLYGLDAARRQALAAGEVIVVEGNFDLIAMHQAGLTHTVATSGTALTPDQAKLLKRAAPRVALTYDGDRAGRDAMMRSLAVLLAEELDVVVVDLPQGDDPDTLIRREGSEGWNRVRGAAYDPVEFVQRHVLGSADGGDPRERALQAVVRLAEVIADPIRFEHFVGRADAVLGGRQQEVRAAVERAVALRKKGQSAAAPIQAVVREQRRGESDLERMLLRALLMAPEAMDETRERVALDLFHDRECLALAEWLWSGRTDLPEEGIAAVLARELAASADAGLDWMAEARGAGRLMVERSLRERLKDRRLELTRVTDGPEATRLQHEINAIAEALRVSSAGA
jgi:DNA primase